MIFVYEFLYRGRDPAVDNSSADYHVVLAEYVDAPDRTKTLVQTVPLSLVQAQQAGFDFTAILNIIATDALERAEKAELAFAELKSAIDQEATLTVATEKKSLLSTLTFGVFK